MKVWLMIGCLLVVATSAQAKFREVTILSIAGGSYQIDDSQHHLVGSRTAIGVKHLLDENWSWFASLGTGAAQQKYLAADQSHYWLEAKTTSFTGGGEYRFSLDKKGAVVPFLGVGLNSLKYELDYTYPGSQVGKVQGTGFGPMVKLGSRFRFGRNFILIPAYQYSSVSIKREDGSTQSLVSSGLFIGLVASF